MPTLATVEEVAWEPLRRGRLAVLVSPASKLAGREIVMLRELAGEIFLVNPRSLARGAFEGLKLMCREFGGFDAKVLESPVASTVALDTDWRPIRDGDAIAVMAETTARAVSPACVAVVPVQPPPRYVLALAGRHGEHMTAVHRFLAYLRAYRDQNAWLDGPGSAPPISESLNKPHRLAGSALSSKGLSRRESEVLRLLAAGESNRRIARRLGLSIHTVDRHVVNLYRKIGARGRADANAHALHNDLA